MHRGTAVETVVSRRSAHRHCARHRIAGAAAAIPMRPQLGLHDPQKSRQATIRRTHSRIPASHGVSGSPIDRRAERHPPVLPGGPGEEKRMTDPPIRQRDGTVLVQGDALPLLYRATLALAARHRRDGVASPPLLHQTRTALYRAVMSAAATRSRPADTAEPCCTLPGRRRPDRHRRSSHDPVAFSSAGGAVSRPGCEGWAASASGMPGH